MKKPSNVAALVGCALGLSSLIGCDTGAPESAIEATTSVESPLFISICDFTPVSATASPAAKQPAGNAIDTSQTTRWESAFADDQFLQVDLGRVLPIYRVDLNWETACGKNYNIEVSNNANGPWTIAAKVTGNTTPGWASPELTSSVSARYVRMHGLTRATQYGFSLFDFVIFTTDVSCPSIDNDHDGFGAGGSACGFCPANPPPATDCNDHLATVKPSVTAYFTAPWQDGSISSWDWNCSGGPEVEMPYGYPSAACLDANGFKTSDCSKCVYSFVNVTTADCGQTRCNLNGPFTVRCH